MKIFCLFLFFCTSLSGQSPDSLVASSESMLKKLTASGDSIIYYQCHVEEAGMQLATASGQTINVSPHKCSITEKFVVTKKSGTYHVKYYSSSLTILPNRKFSALKIREKSYWNFMLNKEFILTPTQLRVLLSIEKKGREAIEYDFVVSKYNTNQLIVKHKKNFKQLVIERDYVLSRLLTK